jgi:hypothetical protein
MGKDQGSGARRRPQWQPPFLVLRRVEQPQLGQNTNVTYHNPNEEDGDIPRRLQDVSTCCGQG